jgi:hypothetical protein
VRHVLLLLCWLLVSGSGVALLGRGGWREGRLR